MKRTVLFPLTLLSAFLYVGVANSEPTPTLAEVRARTPMKVRHKVHAATPVPIPPKKILEVVKFKSPIGQLAAYITPKPLLDKPDQKLPAIVWLTGGDSSTIGDLWTPQPRTNDQTAVAFRNAGIVTMYPSLRGGNENPGFQEFNYGEVEDIVAAADYLATLPYVDAKRIYLGGHSTGGTLVLVTTELTKRFRATFAFGPVVDVRGYGEMVPIDPADKMQALVRSPGYWLDSIKTPTFVFEGDREGNTEALLQMAKANRNPLVQLRVVPNHSHFTIMAPLTELIAQKILKDTNATTNIVFTDQELRGARK